MIEVLSEDGPYMPRWKGTLSKREYRALVAYISAVADKRREHEIPPPLRPTEQPRTERFTYARALFGEICAGCHTLAHADATGRRSDLDQAFLATALETSAERRRFARDAILRGLPASERMKPMPSFRKTLDPEEVAALSAYIAEVAGADRPTDGSDD